MSGRAFAVLRKRAVSCSFSSIYHLPSAGCSGAQFATIDKTVRLGVLYPVIFFGLVGSVSVIIHSYEAEREAVKQNGHGHVSRNN